MSYDEVISLDSHTFMDLFGLIEVIEAQERLKSIEVQCYPNLSAKDQKKVFNNLQKVGYPDFAKGGKPLSNKDIAMALGLK